MDFNKDATLANMTAGSVRINRWLEEVPSDAWSGMLVLGLVACSVVTTALLSGCDVSVDLASLHFAAKRAAPPATA